MTKSGWTHESTNNESVEWYTPPEIFEALGVRFDLDPCSPGRGKSHVPARRHITIDQDGLISPWHGLAFVNPPYGKNTPAWMHKCAEHGNAIALVFSRTDVKWFQELAESTSAICFVSGRIRFYKGNTTSRGGTPGAGSMLIAWGEHAAKILQTSDLGVIVHVDKEELI